MDDRLVNALSDGQDWLDDRVLRPRAKHNLMAPIPTSGRLFFFWRAFPPKSIERLNRNTPDVSPKVVYQKQLPAS